MSVLTTASKMCAAARTAPKAHGKDTLHTLVLTGDKQELPTPKTEEVGMREMEASMNTWHGRDAANQCTYGAGCGSDWSGSNMAGCPALRFLRLPQL